MVGDILELKNITLKPTPTHQCSGNPGYQDYLLKEGLLCSLFLAGTWQCRCLVPPTFNLKRWLWEIRDNTYQSIKKKLSPLACIYFGLIFLGNKEHGSLEDLRNIFNRWGLAHYLARAGLHIVLFIAIWTFIMGLIPAHISFKRACLLIICILYELISWSSIPFVRAFYCFFLIKCGELFGMLTHFLHILSLICFVILLFNPMQLFFLDFQLTFALTFALALFSRLIFSQQKQTGISAIAP